MGQFLYAAKAFDVLERLDALQRHARLTVRRMPEVPVADDAQSGAHLDRIAQLGAVDEAARRQRVVGDRLLFDVVALAPVADEALRQAARVQWEVEAVAEAAACGPGPMDQGRARAQ